MNDKNKQEVFQKYKYTYILRYGELALKGKNRGFFENTLLKNIKSFVKKYDKNAYSMKQKGRMFILSNENLNLKKIFGLKSYSKSFYVGDLTVGLDNMYNKIKKNVSNWKGKTFRVSAKRQDKHYPLNSMEIEVGIGQRIYGEFSNLNVSLKKFDHEVFVEVNNNKVFVTDEKINCYGGLPSEVEKDTIYQILTSDEKLDALSYLLIAKRGIKIVPMILESFYRPEESKIEKIKSIIDSYNIEFEIKNFENVENLKEKIIENKISGVLISENDLEKVADLKQKLNTLMLMPTVTFSQEEIEELIKEYEII
jgi:thiamine biosynthesis protein ThiI